MRMNRELLQQIEDAREIAYIPSRTAFVEKACRDYAVYLTRKSKQLNNYQHVSKL